MERLSGAGGNWRVMDEIADLNVVKQQDQVSCGTACGEMLLRDREIYDVNQAMSAAETGVPVSAESLAFALNSLDSDGSRLWLGGTVSIPGATYSEIIDVLISTSSWGAVLWEPLAELGHIVVVDGIDETGLILIRDPWDATSYKMDREAVEIPADVGNFVTPEEAVSKLKPFECDQKQETSDDSGEPLIDQQQPEEMSQDIRQKAMALVENLPESLLDEAVKVLESWYVKANNLK